MREKKSPVPPAPPVPRWRRALAFAISAVATTVVVANGIATVVVISVIAPYAMAAALVVGAVGAGSSAAYRLAHRLRNPAY